VDIPSNDFALALRMGYSVVTGYRGNSKFNTDRDDDNVLDGTAFGGPTYAHCLRVAYSVGDDKDIIIDNYKGRKSNVYKAKSDNWADLAGNGVFFRSGYIFIANR